MVAAHALAPIPPGARVLDMCAAPGGKTTHLAALQPEAKVLALDRSSRRLALVEELANKLCATNVSTRCMAAESGPEVLGRVCEAGGGRVSGRPEVPQLYDSM